MSLRMVGPIVTCTCSRCGKQYQERLVDTKTFERDNISRQWIPDGWAIHDTQDGDGPEPNKVFILCNECELDFSISVRAFVEHPPEEPPWVG